MPLKTYQNFLSEFAEAPSQPKTDSGYNFQRSAYKILSDHADSFKNLFRGALRRGMVNNHPDFKEALKSMIDLLDNEEITEPRPEDGPVDQNRSIVPGDNLDNVVTVPGADKAGG